MGRSEEDSRDSRTRHYERYDNGDPLYRRSTHRSNRRSRSKSPSVRSRRSNGQRNDRNRDWDGYFERRILERERIKFCLWDRIESPSPDRTKKKTTRERVSDNARHSSDEETSSSEESSTSRRRDFRKSKRQRKSKKSSKKKSSKMKRKKQSKRRRHSRSESSDSASDKDSGDSKESSITEEKEIESLKISSINEIDQYEAKKFKESVQNRVIEDSEGVGPNPLPETGDADSSSLNYGKQLLPGEGAAIAQYVQKNMRIPRRGEVGWSGQEIEGLEDLGYVMSGSRHTRMNAIRIRKENQVYSAEEKRALTLINFEEKQQRENQIMQDFREMLTSRLSSKHGADKVEDMESAPPLDEI